MQHYSDNVQDLQGNARPGVPVSVYSGAVLATIYSDNGTTVKANPMTSGAGGAFDFYAANGEYTISASGASKGITLFDAAAAVTATPTSSDTVLGVTAAGAVRRFPAGFTQSGAGAVARTITSKLGEGYATTADYTALPVATTPNQWFWNYTNPDGAGAAQLTQTIPNTVSMVGNGNVQGCGLIISGDTAAATPNTGYAETNALRINYTVNAAAGQWLQTHLINGMLSVAHNVGAANTEGAVLIGTMRATGPAAGGSNVAMGLWGGDFHVEKAAGVADGKMVGLEVGVHKAPALGTERANGIEVWSGDRSGITATRAGDMFKGFGAAGWTNFLNFLHTDSSTAVCLLTAGGNLTVCAPTGSQSVEFTSNANNTSSTLTVSGKTAGGDAVNGVMQADGGGQLTFGSSTNHPLVLIQNGVERLRFSGGTISATGFSVDADGDTTVKSVTLTESSAPANASASGTAGQIAWDANYVYVAVATNTWKRAALSTW